MLKKIKGLGQHHQGEKEKKGGKQYKEEKPHKEGKVMGMLHGLKPSSKHGSSSPSSSAGGSRADLEGKTLEIDHKVRVQVLRKVAEGGFAYVYAAKDADHRSGSGVAKSYALKRVYVADSADLPQARKELEILRSLPPHRNIVPFIAGQLVNNPAESSSIYLDLLLGFASGGSIVDRLNQGGKYGMKEGEVWSIFQATCEAVAHLHGQTPPIVHRDLKAENLLLGDDGAVLLCDFGSATSSVMAPRTSAEIQRCDEELQRYTTLSYRAPEMCDLYCGKAINHKADVWALGVLLFRLAFFLPPFEDNRLAILNLNYSVPPDSPYSQALLSVLRSCLQIDPASRPHIFSLLHSVASISGIPPLAPLRDLFDENSLPQDAPDSFFSTLAPSSPANSLPIPHPSHHSRSASVGASTHAAVSTTTTHAPNYADRHRDRARPAKQGLSIFDLVDPSSITIEPVAPIFQDSLPPSMSPSLAPVFDSTPPPQPHPAHPSTSASLHHTPDRAASPFFDPFPPTVTFSQPQQPFPAFSPFSFTQQLPQQLPQQPQSLPFPQQQPPSSPFSPQPQSSPFSQQQQQPFPPVFPDASFPTAFAFPSPDPFPPFSPQPFSTPTHSPTLTVSPASSPARPDPLHSSPLPPSSVIASLAAVDLWPSSSFPPSAAPISHQQPQPSTLPLNPFSTTLTFTPLPPSSSSPAFSPPVAVATAAAPPLPFQPSSHLAPDSLHRRAFSAGDQHHQQFVQQSPSKK